MLSKEDYIQVLVVYARCTGNFNFTNRILPEFVTSVTQSKRLVFVGVSTR